MAEHKELRWDIWATHSTLQRMGTGASEVSYKDTASKIASTFFFGGTEYNEKDSTAAKPQPASIIAVGIRPRICK